MDVEMHPVQDEREERDSYPRSFESWEGGLE